MNSWKQAVSQYVEARNQAELDGDSGALRQHLPDLSHLQQWLKRQDHVREGRQQRGIQPHHHETRMRVERVSESEGETVADIQFRHALSYDQYTKGYSEERIERERVWLKEHKGKWRIVKIQPEIAEKSPSVMGKMKIGKKEQVLHASAYRKGRSKTPGQPYMNQAVLDSSRSLMRQRVYQRRKAQEYADRWWDQPNPEFVNFQVDCTNYVSQCLYAGGAPMNYTGNRATGWWLKGQGGSEEWSFSWSVAHSLYWYLNNSQSGLTAERVQSAMDLDIGDVIIYDWDGNGEYQHSTIVTAFDGDGMPLVNAHTSNSRHRYWDYRDSYAWSEQTVYRFFHIADVF